MLEHLPKECGIIYNGRSGETKELYNQMLEESLKFEEFRKKISKTETVDLDKDEIIIDYQTVYNIYGKANTTKGIILNTNNETCVINYKNIVGLPVDSNCHIYQDIKYFDPIIVSDCIKDDTFYVCLKHNTETLLARFDLEINK